MAHFCKTLLLSLFIVSCASISGVRPVEVGPPEPSAKLPSEKMRVTVVAGGAGVASFALVGFLKRLEEERIDVELLISNGWPSLFTLGYGFLKTIHDVEWFAMRCSEKEFQKTSVLFSSSAKPPDRFTDLIEKSFSRPDQTPILIQQANKPVALGAVQASGSNFGIFSEGDWHYPLFASMAVPNTFSEVPRMEGEEWANRVNPIDVEEAIRRGSKVIVAVTMYDDFLEQLQNRGPILEKYRTQLGKKLEDQLSKAHRQVRIKIQKGILDFSAKRTAIQAGYRQAIKLCKDLKRP